MRLLELNPHWAVDQSGRRMGVNLDCPICRGVGRPRESGEYCSGRLHVPFAVGLDGKPAHPRGWDRTGDTFEVLTLSPSINVISGGCKWHGFITNGAVTSVP